MNEENAIVLMHIKCLEHTLLCRLAGSRVGEEPVSVHIEFAIN
jgi:hypothetical protein